MLKPPKSSMSTRRRHEAKSFSNGCNDGIKCVTDTVQAADIPEGPHLATSGTSSVSATPDIATLTFQVTASAKDAASAKTQVDERVAKYFDFLKTNGIEKKISVPRISVLSLNTII